jgi:ATP-dependent helicase/DNAse subunit B
MEINHISVSRVGVYQTCPQQYKYKYHLKLESPEPEPFYFVYGKIVHKIAEEYVREKGARTIQEITDAVLGGEILIETYQGDDLKAPPLPPTEQKRLPGHLRAIYQFTQNTGFEGELEFPFEYDLDPPNEKMVVGYIDRLIEKNGEYFIIDYKTTKRGRWRKTKTTIKKDLQLRCYSRVVQKTFDVPADKIQAALLYVEGGDLIGAKFSQKSLEQAEEELLTAFNEIENRSPDKVWGKIGRHCDRCDYRSICPFINKPKLPPSLSKGLTNR